MLTDINPEEDGITHINIYSKARTQLGKFMSNFAPTPITFKGKAYQSIEGLWFSYITGDETIADLSGWKAKEYGRKKEKIREIDEQLIKDAIDIKIKTYVNMQKELAESILPLTHYYCYGGKVVPAGYEFLTLHWMLRRDQLKKHFNIK